MRSALGIILISAVLATAILGAFAMYHASGNHARCPIAAFGGNNCANIINPFEFAASHIATILGFSVGVIVLPAVFLLSGLSILFTSLIFGAAGPPRYQPFIYSRIANGNQPNSSHEKWLHWFSILGKRDPSEFSATKG